MIDVLEGGWFKCGMDVVQIATAVEKGKTDDK